MDDSPPAKRRRTSPRFAGRDGSTEAPALAAASTTSTTTPPDPPPPATASAIPRPRPPSFASPTRASLARHNPAILERRQSVPRSQGANGDDSDDEALLYAQLGQSSSEKERAENTTRPLARPPRRSPVRSSPVRSSPARPLAQPPSRASRSPSRSPTRRLFGSTMFSAPAQHSPQAAARHRQLESVASGGSLLGEPPRRSPIKPVPRPLPPPDPQRSEDVLAPLMARDRRRSGLELFRVHEEPPPEPELPPTPEHPDPALMTSPPGIHHSSTPTKRPKRAQKMRSKINGPVQSSSPLKQPPLKPPPQQLQTIQDASSTPIGNADALKDASGNVPRRGRGRPRKTSAARGIQPPDPDAAKNKERDDVLAEIAGLEADLALAAAENARIREAVENGGDRVVPLPANRRDLLSLLRRRALPAEEEDAPDATADWLRAATNPIAFLPFGKPRADLAELLQFGTGSASADDDEIPISHHPIAMTAAEELPFLQAFTPLAFRAHIVVLPQQQPQDPLLQKHIITATSTAPAAGLLLARIEMTVHSKSLRIADLQVPRIDPPAAAAELRPLLDRVTGDAAAAGSALARNVTVLAWALGEWVRVAVRRAHLWAALARLQRDKGAGLAASARRLRARKRRRRRGRGDDEGGDEDDEDAEDVLSSPIAQAELREHLGRTAMDVEVPSSSSSIRIEWAIQFDWTGEAQSRIGVLVGVPGKWRRADKRGRLGRLPRLFDQLVQGGGDPLAAVQTVAALLAGEDGAGDV